MPDASLEFNYDYDLLARWLLKTAYNSSRGAKHHEDAEALSQYTHYMLGDDPRPRTLSVCLLLVAPYEAKESETSLNELDGRNVITKDGQKFFQPQLVGSRGVQFSASELEGSTTHLILLNSFFFSFASSLTTDTPKNAACDGC